MGDVPDPEVIRLTVPGQADFVSVLRVAARVVAGRAGAGDDARSRLQAAIGQTFFALLDGIEPTATVALALTAGDRRITAEVSAPGGAIPESAVAVGDLVDGHERSADGSALRLWVDC